MYFIFSTPVLIRHLWELKTVVFLHLVSNIHYSITETFSSRNIDRARVIKVLA